MFSPFFYSYLIASIGSGLAAFFAGYHPKKTPVNVQTAKLIIMLQGSIWVAIWKKEFRLSDKLTYRGQVPNHPGPYPYYCNLSSSIHRLL